MNHKSRKYNRLIADETIEDYSLRYAPKSFRKFSELLIANTAIGSISFLALEAIGAGIGLQYGFSTGIWAIFVASLIIFITALPISYYAAKNNIDIDLITRSAGFGYVGSTFTSLIYASFSFIFFALEASIMAQALEVYFGLPLSLGYLLSSLVVIPLVFYGITVINRLQLYTQPLWVSMMIIPFVAILIKDPHALDTFSTLKGSISHSDSFDWYYFGFAIGISLSLIAQIGEQVDYLRFMPPLTQKNRFKWWFSVLSAGPGWIILGFLKQAGGMFLVAIAMYGGYSALQAKTPIEMYSNGYSFVFDNPALSLSAATLFVLISQVKINVTNAYAGSLAWSNFFSRITHSHPGRVVWMVFNIGIALLLMELGIFDVLEKILGLYSNFAIAWIGAIFADLVINKPLGLSPKIAEFKRAHLFNINPVGVGSMGIASFISALAFMGAFGAYAQSYSALLAMSIAIILAPFIAWLTGGKYYIARENELNLKAGTHYVCETCNHTYEKEDLSFCPFHDSYICSLCCSLDSLCHDSCKIKSQKGLREKIGETLSKLFFKKISPTTSLKIFDFLLMNFFLIFLVSITSWMAYSIYGTGLSLEKRELIADVVFHYAIIVALILSIVSWWILLLQSSRQRAEDLLETQNKALESEVIIRKKAEQKAEHEAKIKSEFLANMSHEIRTPMNSIIGMGYLARQTELDKKQKNYLEKIDVSAKSLLNIINDILDFSKMESGKMQLQKASFDMLELLHESINMFETQVKEKNIQLKFFHGDDIGRHFIGDKLRLSQVLVNLLSNAVKFTKEGEININIKKIKHNRLEFCVQDTGIGLEDEQKEKLFEPFIQADGSTTRKYGGTGLGLSISKEIVSLMNGKIWVESKKDKGSSFCFEIELQELMDGELLKDAKQVDYKNDDYSELQQKIQSLSGSKILLVEDNEINHEIVKGLLDGSGIVVDIALNGEEGVQKYKNNSYELILMDLIMPVMNGYQATKIIRQENETLPIIALSANALVEDIQKTKEYGMNAHITKPIDIKALYKILLEYIPKKSDSFTLSKKQEEQQDKDIFYHFKTLNPQEALHLLGNNKKLYEKILLDFRTKYSTISFKDINNTTLERTLHTLKGLAKNIGATKLHDLLLLQDSYSKEELLKNLQENIKDILQDISLLKMHEEESSSLLELDEEKKALLKTSLIKALKSKRPNKIAPVLKEIEKYRLKNRQKEQFKKILLFINKYKYDEALEQIDE